MSGTNAAPHPRKRTHKKRTQFAPIGSQGTQFLAGVQGAEPLGGVAEPPRRSRATDPLKANVVRALTA